MDFTLSEDQVQLRDGIRRFIVEQYDFESRRKRMAVARGSDREMWARFAEMGWLAVLVPEAAGGLGWTMIDASIIAQEFGRGLVVEPFLEAGILATRILALSDTATGNALLPRIASGESLVAPALLEERLRYDAGPRQTQVQIRGDSLSLTGRKVLIPGGDVADHLIVSAMGHDGPALVLVPTEAAGVRRETYRALDGGWLSDVVLDAVQLPSEAVIAGGNRASKILAQSVDDAALGAGAEAVGCMDRALEITADYLRTRVQFGQALAEFQVLQHRMADLFVETEMARSALFAGLSALDANPSTRAAAVSAARVRIDQAAAKVGSQGIHLHGGMGMTIEYPIGHYHRRLLVLARTFGDTDFHLDRYEQLRVAAA